MLTGEKISHLRKNKGISQELLAENAKTSVRTIQRIETGVSAPRPYTLKAIADALGVAVEELRSAEKQPIDFSAHEVKALQSINSSALIVLFVPVVHLFLPVWLWRKHRTSEAVNQTGRRIISFQLLWTLATVVALVVAQLLQVSITGSAASGHFPLLLIVYSSLVIINLIFTLRASWQIRTDPERVFSFIPVIF